MAPNEYEYPNMKNPKIIRAREKKKHASKYNPTVEALRNDFIGTH